MFDTFSNKGVCFVRFVGGFLIVLLIFVLRLF